MDSLDSYCSLEMDCEQESDDEEVFRAFLSKGNREVEITDEGDMYIIKEDADLSDVPIEDMTGEGRELEGIIKYKGDISEEESAISDEEDEEISEKEDGGDKDWSGSDDESSISTSSSEDLSDEELLPELAVLAGKPKSYRENHTNKRVGCEKNNSACGKRKPCVTASEENKQITVVRVGLDNQVISKYTITDKKDIQLTLENLRKQKRKDFIQSKGAIKKSPGKMFRVPKVKKSSANTSLSQTLNGNGDGPQSNSAAPGVVKRATVLGNVTETDMITDTTQTASTFTRSSVLTPTVENGEKSLDVTQMNSYEGNSFLPTRRVWKEDGTSSLGGHFTNISCENLTQLPIRQEPDDDLETFSTTKVDIKQEPKDDLETFSTANVDIKQEPKDDLETFSTANVDIKQEPNDDLETFSTSYKDIREEPNDDLETLRTTNLHIKQEPKDDLETFSTTNVDIKQEPNDDLETVSTTYKDIREEPNDGLETLSTTNLDIKQEPKDDIETFSTTNVDIKQEPNDDLETVSTTYKDIRKEPNDDLETFSTTNVDIKQESNDDLETCTVVIKNKLKDGLGHCNKDVIQERQKDHEPFNYLDTDHAYSCRQEPCEAMQNTFISSAQILHTKKAFCKGARKSNRDSDLKNSVSCESQHSCQHLKRKHSVEGNVWGCARLSSNNKEMNDHILPKTTNTLPTFKAVVLDPAMRFVPVESECKLKKTQSMRSLLLSHSTAKPTETQSTTTWTSSHSTVKPTHSQSKVKLIEPHSTMIPKSQEHTVKPTQSQLMLPVKPMVPDKLVPLPVQSKGNIAQSRFYLKVGKRLKRMASGEMNQCLVEPSVLKIETVINSLLSEHGYARPLSQSLSTVKVKKPQSTLRVAKTRPIMKNTSQQSSTKDPEDILKATHPQIGLEHPQPQAVVKVAQSQTTANVSRSQSSMKPAHSQFASEAVQTNIIVKSTRTQPLMIVAQPQSATTARQSQPNMKTVRVIPIVRTDTVAKPPSALRTTQPAFTAKVVQPQSPGYTTQPTIARKVEQPEKFIQPTPTVKVKRPTVDAVQPLSTIGVVQSQATMKDAIQQSTVKIGQPKFTVKIEQPESTGNASQPKTTMETIQPQISVKVEQPQSIDSVKVALPESTVETTQFTLKVAQPQFTLKSTQSTAKSTQTQSTAKVAQTQSTVKVAQSQSTVKTTQPEFIVKQVLHQFPVKPVPLGMNANNAADSIYITEPNDAMLLQVKDQHNVPCPMCTQCFPTLPEMLKHCKIHYVHTPSTPRKPKKRKYRDR